MKDIPLSEITLRKYEKPEKLEKRELKKNMSITWFAAAWRFS